MEVFSRSYLKAVVETQGELFDSSARRHPDCDTDDFIASYMTGKTRADIDAGQAYVCTMNADDLAYIKSAYRGLHDLELELAVAKVSGIPAMRTESRQEK